MKKYFILSLLSIIFCGLTFPAVAAVDLIDIYNQATASDPVYQAANSTMMSNHEQLPQSIAPLLPNISATANTASNSFTANSNDFTNRGYTVSLNQSLLNFNGWMQVSQAKAAVKQADATFGAAAQDLMIRVAQDYFAVLQAEDNLHYTEIQKTASIRQLDQTKARFHVGLDTITSVYNAQAQYDAIVAQEIADQNSVRNSLEALRQLTGDFYPEIENLKIRPPLITPEPANVDRWVATAENENLTLLAARFGTEAARANVKVNFANHFPTLTAVASYGKNGGGSGSNSNNSNNSNNNIPGQSGSSSANKSLGLQLNIPIYQGGLISSQTRQAEDNYATQSANMENTYRQTIVTTRQKYNDVVAGISKINADNEAILSAESSYKSTQESFKVGTRTIVDVLTAQQALYQAQRQFAQDQYTYLLNTLLLKQAAGSLNAGDLSKINAWLHHH